MSLDLEIARKILDSCAEFSYYAEASFTGQLATVVNLDKIADILRELVEGKALKENK